MYTYLKPIKFTGQVAWKEFILDKWFWSWLKLLVSSQTFVFRNSGDVIVPFCFLIVTSCSALRIFPQPLIWLDFAKGFIYLHFSLRFEPPFLIIIDYCRSRKLYCLIYLCEIEKPDFILWIPHTNTCTKAYLGYIYLLFSLLCSSYFPSALNSTSDIAKLPINSLINTNLLFHLLGNKKYFTHFFLPLAPLFH